MCGFCGFTKQIIGETQETVLQNMMDKIIHRGPDAQGTYIDENIAIGFRRLSIVDLSGGNQPLFNEDKSLVMVFNGEIYNHKIIRADLEAKGHVFATDSDGECILHLYEEYGEEMPMYLRGMFAIVIYDIKRKRLYAARDFFGIKPLYYTQMNGTFCFGSEIKSFLAHPDFEKELNEEALAQYLTFQYSVLPETFFKGVFKLPPGHFLVYEDGEITITRYFSAKFSPKEMTLEEAEAALGDAIDESIRTHMESDLEIGTFLSGGVDSSFVAASFGGKRAFTVGFEQQNYSEIEYAKELAQKLELEHHTKIIATDEYWNVLPKIQYYMDEPLADPAAVAFYFACEDAAKHVKITLSGEGADEFFGGYNIYKEPLDLKPITSLPRFVRRALGWLAHLLPSFVKGRNFLIRGSKTVEERFIGNAYMFAPKERMALLKGNSGKHPMEITAPFYKEAEGMDDITKMQHIDIHMWMVGDILLQADKMSMAHCLEVRVPLTDKEVFKVAAELPTHLRVNKTATKFAFRKLAEKRLPKENSKRKKLGFPVPIRVWLREEKYYNAVKAHFAGEIAERYFNTNILMQLLNNHYQGKKDNSRKIWTVYMFLLWYEEFFS